MSTIVFRRRQRVTRQAQVRRAVVCDGTRCCGVGLLNHVIRDQLFWGLIFLYPVLEGGNLALQGFRLPMAGSWMLQHAVTQSVESVADGAPP